jgi:hypothetical protein
MNAADGWDTILVAEGTYSEAVVFSQNNITLRAFGSPENTIITQAAGTVVDFNTKYGCTLDGFTVSLSAATSTNDEVIYSNNSHSTAYNIVKDCIITGQNKAGSVFGLYGINIDDGNFELFHNRITITQTEDSALYAIWNTAAHTSRYIGNTLVIDQQSTGANMTSGFHHHAGAGSIMYCEENIETIDSTHTAAGIGYGVYASAENNYVNDNIIDADASSTGEMYGLYTGTGKTAKYNGNTLDVTTGDGDGEWANFGTGTSYIRGNIVTGDGIMGTGGTIYTEYATNDETITGTATDRAVTPAGLTAWSADKSSGFTIVEKAADSAILTDAELRPANGKEVLVTNRGWDGNDDQTFPFPEADDDTSAGCKFKFLVAAATAGTADIYWDTEGSTTNIYWNGTPVGDGVRIWFEDPTVGQGMVCHSYSLDGTTYDWFCDSINGGADKGS